MADKKDRLGDIVLWSFWVTLAATSLQAITNESFFGYVAVVPLGIFGVFCIAAFFFRVVDFVLEIKAFLGNDKRR